MSVSIGAFPGQERRNEWLSRLCLKYVNRVNKQGLAAFAELWADLPLALKPERPAAEVEIRTLARSGGVPALLRLHNEAYVGATDYRRAGWVEGLALQTAKGYDPTLIYIAFMVGRPVGFCMSRKRGQTGRITGVAVRPEFRCRGIGAALLDHAMRELSARGATGVYLHADPDQPASHRLYTKMGFSVRQP